jgi:hypothetical protein
MLRRILTLIVVAASLANGYAQQSPNMDALNPKEASTLPLSSAATTTCQSTFTSGSGLKQLSYCVTANGNILNFTAPQGFLQEFNREGYGICDFTTAPEVSYTDEASNDTGNWLNPTISQPNGPNTFPLTITRMTADGIWKLKQSFSQSPVDRSVKVVMSFTNLTVVARSAFVLRYMDVDADGGSGGDIFVQGTLFSLGTTVFNPNNHGVVLAALPGPLNFTGFNGNAGGEDACAVSAPPANPFTGDGALMYEWKLSGVAPGATQSVTFEYRAM